jgi:hypothetical protein
MGVTIRERSDRADGVWWVFVSYMNRRTSFRVGSKDAAEDVQHELQVMLALDRAIQNLRPRGLGEPQPELDPALKREAMDLRYRLSRLLRRLEEAMAHNAIERTQRTQRGRLRVRIRK